MIHDNEIMGRTIPSFRRGAEIERAKWNLFRQELDKSERKMVGEMMSYSRLYNAAGVMACKPVLLHSILIFEHYKQLKKMKVRQLLASNNVFLHFCLFPFCLYLKTFHVLGGKIKWS